MYILFMVTQDLGKLSRKSGPEYGRFVGGLILIGRGNAKAVLLYLRGLPY
jgi:hypothetical protein